MEFRVRIGLPALLLFLSLPFISGAQNNASLDSLLLLAEDPQRLPESTILLLTDQVGKYPSPVDRATLCLRISSAYLIAGQLDSAASNAWNVLTLVPENPALCSTAYLSLGLVAYQKSALERASDFFGKSLHVFETLGNKNGQLVAWNYLARISERQARLPEALRNYQQSMEIAMSIQDSARIGALKIELAIVNRKLSRFPEALTYLNQSLEAIRQRRDSSRLVEVLVELGNVAEDQSDYTTALKYFFQALKMERKSGSGFSGYVNVSRIFGAMTKLDVASRYADSAEMAAIEGRNLNDLRLCFQWRYKLAEQLMDTAKTFSYYKRYVQYDDSVKQVEASQRIQNVHDELILGANEASIRTADLEKKLVEARAESDQQWLNFLFLLSGSTALLALFLFFWFRSRSQTGARIRETEQKLAELTILKEKMFTVMAHDLQGPVSAFTRLTDGFAGQTNSISPEELKTYLRALNVSGLELTRSLSQLVEWAVTQSGTMPFRRELVNCRQVADEVERQLHPMAEEKRLEVAFLIPEALHAYGDRAMIAIVLRTLLYNAIRFTGEGRTITLFSGRKDDLITLGVKDNGEGLSADRIRKIFDWSTDSMVIGRGRTGIGLPMCKELVSRNGGNLYVESTLKQGSTFYFSLPEHPPIA